MGTKIIIPGALRGFTGQQKSANYQAADVGSLLNQLVLEYPALKTQLFDEQNQVRRFINIFVNEEDIRFLLDQNTPIKESDVVELVPAISGG